jgi:hypothetical protein
MSRAGILVLALAAGCGGGASLDVEALHTLAGVQANLSPGTGELRILGVNGSAFSSVAMTVGKVEVRAGGKLVTGAVQTKKIELANAAQAWLLAKFAVPEGAGELEVSVSLEEAGSFAAGKSSGKIHAGCTELKFVVQAAQLKPRGHAVIHVDLARSLVKLHQGAEFVQNFSLHY